MLFQLDRIVAHGFTRFSLEVLLACWSFSSPVLHTVWRGLGRLIVIPRGQPRPSPFHSAVSVPSQLWASQKRACRASDAMMSPNCNYVLSRQKPRSDSTNSEYLEKSIFKTKILSPTMGCYKWSFSFSCQLWKSSKVRAPSQTKGAIPHVSFINVTGCPFLGGRESHTF